jgi:iron complex transport system substrate-binding protein
MLTTSMLRLCTLRGIRAALCWAALFLVWSPSLALVATPHTFIDDVGRAVTVHTPLRRIISLAPSVTEILLALHMDEHVVAVTDFCDFPEEATRKPKVGAMYQPSIERIVALQPDLVITAVGASKKETVLRLEGLAVPVYVLNPTSVAEIFAAIERVGALGSREQAAAKVVADLRQRLAAVTTRLVGQRPIRTLYVLWYQPLVSVGRGSFLHEVITLAGGENLAQDAPQAYPTYSLEQVIAAAPEVIILSSDSAPLQQLMGEQPERWTGLPAMREGRIYVVDTGLLNRPSPRSVEAVETLARYFHPEAFAYDR